MGTGRGCAARIDETHRRVHGTAQRDRVHPDRTGSVYEASGRALYLGVSGRGSVAGENLRRLTTVYLDNGEDISIRGEETLELLRLGLPALDARAAVKMSGARAAELVD
ncbi:MAG TPA: hypothetical protein VHX61_01650 [Rhizomicrobium sp.]|jgi:hypothetical protein|nr:hypothetical protein [Rhizomicrobium sp.]